MGIKIYSAAEHSFNFCGIPIESGRGPDEFLSYDQKEDNFSYSEGVDGEGTRSETKVNYIELKLTLVQTSSSNDVLSAIFQGDIAVPGGAGIGPLLARDRQGKTVLSSAEAWITRPPAQKRGKQVGTLEWTFGVHNPKRFDGGS